MILMHRTFALQLQMENQKSVLEETKELLQERVKFFSSYAFSAENVLAQPSALTIRSLSEIIPQLCRFELVETPLHINLADIYLGRQASTTPLENSNFKFLLPPVSEGEDSITEEDAFQPSFKWVSNAIVDSTFLATDKVEPKKVERGKAHPEWKGVVQLLLYNVDRKIYLKAEMNDFQEHLKNRFEKYPWIKIRKSREIYYKGKPSIILRFSDETSASFAYFNLVTSTQKQAIGQSCEILRIVDNKLKEKIASEVTLVFRKLPLNMSKQIFLSLFKNKGPTWMEQLIEIQGFKYTICKVTYLEDAFHMITTFQSKKIKEAKVNYHPKSAKKWKLNEQPAYFEA